MDTGAARGCYSLCERDTTADELEVRLGQSFFDIMVGDCWDPVGDFPLGIKEGNMGVQTDSGGVWGKD